MEKLERVLHNYISENDLKSLKTEILQKWSFFRKR